MLESLKKRHSNRVYPAVPCRPGAARETLDLVRASGCRTGAGRAGGVRLRPWVRMTGGCAVHAVMEAAPTPRPKRLPHGFGVAASRPASRLNLVQKWLGQPCACRPGSPAIPAYARQPCTVGGVRGVQRQRARSIRPPRSSCG